MSGELNIKYSATGKTILALILGPNRTNRWNGTAMVAINSVSAADWTTGMVELTENRTNNFPAVYTGTYAGDFPAGIAAAGEYAVEYYLSTAATPGSQAVGLQAVWWDGTKAIRPSGAGEKMDLVNFPNSAAITAIQNGLATSSGVSGVLSAVLNVQNNTFITTNIPGILQVPASGDPQSVQITIVVSDETGAAHDIDSSANPTAVLVNNDGTDRSLRLSAWQHPATGKYTTTYTNSAGDAVENLYWEITATVNSILRRYVATTQLVNTVAVDFTATDRQALSGIATQLGTAGSGLTAIGDSRLSNLDAAVSLVKSKTDNLPANPAAIGSAMTLQSAERDATAAALLDLGNAIDGKTLRQALQIIASVLAGKVSGAGSGTETFRGLDDQHNRVVVTADISGNRSNVTYQ
jgi:hypothetical protein